MGASKITDLSSIIGNVVNDSDKLLILDESDTTDSPEGTHKQISISDLRTSIMPDILSATMARDVYIEESSNRGSFIITGDYFINEQTLVEIGGGCIVTDIDVTSTSSLLVKFTAGNIISGTGYDVTVSNIFGSVIIENMVKVSPGG